ncbi:9690_t:CDS:2, partial [Racocetra fulgida]
QEELKNIQNHINSLNPQSQNINVYEIIDSLGQEELKNIQNYINSLNPQLQNINIYEIIDSLGQEELKNIQNHINSLNSQSQNINVYEIIDSFDQEDGLFKQHSSAKDFQDKVKKLETENNKFDSIPRVLENNLFKCLPPGYRAYKLSDQVLLWLEELQCIIANPYIIFDKEFVEAQSKLCDQEFSILIHNIKIVYLKKTG